jgi:serine/threonine protein kinase
MGVVLFFMLTGYLPFQHKNTHTLYKLILGAKYEVPRSVSKLAGDLIISLLRVNPSRRLKPSDIKAHPWIRLYTGKNDIL